MHLKISKIAATLAATGWTENLRLTMTKVWATSYIV